MKRVSILVTVFVVVLSCAAIIAAEQDADRKADVKAIRQLAASYAAAFSRGDAKAVAAIWAPDADYIDLKGEVIKGRDEIEKRYAAIFAENPGLKLSVRLLNMRFLGSKIAVVDSVPEVTPAISDQPGEPRSCIVLVKRGDGWLVASARATITFTPSNYEYLKELEWLIGDWVDAGSAPGEVSVQSTCDWTMNKNFIIRKFDAEIKGRITTAGTQLIGWDPRSHSIRSWVFDSNGGFGEGIWKRDGERWIIKTTHVLQDGSRDTATNTLTPIDGDTFTFQSRNRLKDGQRQPNIEEIEIRRQTPQKPRQDTPAGGDATPGKKILPEPKKVLPEPKKVLPEPKKVLP